MLRFVTRFNFKRCLRGSRRTGRVHVGRGNWRFMHKIEYLSRAEFTDTEDYPDAGKNQMGEQSGRIMFGGNYCLTLEKFRTFFCCKTTNVLFQPNEVGVST